MSKTPMKLIVKQIFLLTFIVLLLFGVVDFVLAEDVNICDPLSSHCAGDGSAGAPSVSKIVGRVIQIVLGIVGSLALLMFVYGGFVLMLSAGNGDRVQKGKDVLIWATIGLIVVFTAYAAVAFIIEGFTVGG